MGERAVLSVARLDRTARIFFALDSLFRQRELRAYRVCLRDRRREFSLYPAMILPAARTRP
ncbi:hypothetical protein C5Y97_28880 [Blastopirellula marina]|uniref:Uncharacterized protein n=1 Tax=Blastopirellula marina TaxID=124 RepID=A0A2S8GAL6_9BACT|nr:hypothetical protein C5Y98_28865 [Blastopirellula marina]PQO41477.1 hypothetical protein C5Y93_30670 [Blastopirellula marina]PTL40994.1 hypothetical protein C5Y97_28880 [Blastopirellula marina]